MSNRRVKVKSYTVPEHTRSQPIRDKKSDPPFVIIEKDRNREIKKQRPKTQKRTGWRPL